MTSEYNLKENHFHNKGCIGIKEANGETFFFFFKQALFTSDVKIMHGQVVKWLATRNEKSLDRVRIPVEFVTLTFAQVPMGERYESISISPSPLWIKY